MGTWQPYYLNGVNVYVYANYTLTDYVITFVADGEEIYWQYFNIESAEIPSPNIPWKTGYTAQWEEYVIGPNDITVNAIYTANQYIVYFNYDYATSGNTMQTAIVTFGQPVGTLPTPEKTGYNFMGWYYRGQWITASTVWNIDYGAATLNAIWSVDEYTATFKADGQTVSVQTYTSNNKNITVPTVPEKTGYTGAWEEYTLTSGNIVINAIYTPITYTITFKADNTVVDIQTYTVENRNITVPTVPEKTGYTGVWEQYTLTIGDLTVNAIYSKQCTITLNYNGATSGNTLQTVTVTYGQPVGTLPTPQKTGYTFAGWQYNGNTIASNTIWTDDIDTAIFNAQWTDIYYTVTFDSNGGSEVASIINALYNSVIDEPTAPEKDAAVFDGWYKDSALTARWNFSSDTVTNDTTLYAKWIDYSQYLIFTLNGNQYSVKGSDSAKNATSITIPSKYNGKSVTSIENNGFESCGSLASITIPNSVTSIGSNAFYDCSSLESITIPNSVTNIGKGAFENCSSLESITIPFVGGERRSVWCRWTPHREFSFWLYIRSRL